MDLIRAFALLLAVSVGLTLLLAMLVVGRKVLRDRREDVSTARRRRLRQAFGAGDGRSLRRALAGIRRGAAEVDLIAVLEETGGPDRALLNREARRSGLLGHLDRRLRSRRASARGRTVLLLARLRLPGEVHSLAARLDDDDPDVRLASAAGLPLAHDAAAVEALVTALSLRRLAPERVIERLGQPWAVDPLLEALHRLDERGERRAAPRVAVARALGIAGDRRAEGALVALLRDGSTEERISAARALGEVGGRRARPELERALGDESWPLRAQAAKALGKIGVERAVPALAAVLGDQAWWVRANAAAALRELGRPGRAALERALSHEDPYARDRAREALALDRLKAA